MITQRRGQTLWQDYFENFSKVVFFFFKFPVFINVDLMGIAMITYFTVGFFFFPLNRAMHFLECSERSFIILFNWGIIALQYCVGFCM